MGTHCSGRGCSRVKCVPGQHGKAPYQLAMLSPCHPMPCPSLPCHDTRSSTQTGQPLWPGLISCHSRWNRNQGHCVVCSLTAQVPTDLPQTLTAQEQCLRVCVSVCMCGHFCVLEVDRDNENGKKRQDVTLKGTSECSVHMLPHRQAERNSFYCKCG